MSTIRWFEQWKSPGVCLVARSQVMGRGLAHLANIWMSPAGTWLFVHNNQALLLDMPFAEGEAEVMLRYLSRHLQKHTLHLKYLTVSHLHFDHAAGLTTTLRRFLDATFIYPATWPDHAATWTYDRLKYGYQPELEAAWTRQPQHTYREWVSVDLAGEPLFLMEAPYHSPTDQLVIFRGVALLPDWHLPEHPNQQLDLVDAPTPDIQATLRRLHRFEQQTGYVIHSRLAVHGDEPLRTDFRECVHTARQMFNVMD